MKTQEQKTKSAPTASAPETKPLIVNLSAETMEALVNLICEQIFRALTPLLILNARLSAADTVHTPESRDAIFRRAIEDSQAILDKIYDGDAKWNR